LIQNHESDLETIEAIFAVAQSIFNCRRFPSSAPARTALIALNAPRAADYSTLDFDVREKVTVVFAKLAASNRQVKAAAVFGRLADALDNISD